VVLVLVAALVVVVVGVAVVVVMTIVLIAVKSLWLFYCFNVLYLLMCVNFQTWNEMDL